MENLKFLENNVYFNDLFDSEDSLSKLNNNKLLKEKNIQLSVGETTSSVYVNVYENEEMLFIIRMFDHSLSEHNYLPAGVINEFEDEYLSAKNVLNYWEFYRLLDEEEIEELWTPRLVASL